MSYHHFPIIFQITAQNQVICLQEAGNPHFLRSSKNVSPILSIPIFISFIIPSIHTLKSQGDMTNPCYTPLLILQQLLSPSTVFTQARLLTYPLILSSSLPPTSYIHSQNLYLYNGTATTDLQYSGTTPHSKAILQNFKSQSHHSSSNLILTCSFHFLKLFHSHLHFSPPK